MGCRISAPHVDAHCKSEKFEKGTFDSSMRPEYEFGHLDQPGESGGGTDAWNADAALEARREAGTGFDEPVAFGVDGGEFLADLFEAA
jgi:hypothetical protein